MKLKFISKHNFKKNEIKNLQSPQINECTETKIA